MEDAFQSLYLIGSRLKARIVVSFVNAQGVEVCSTSNA